MKNQPLVSIIMPVWNIGNDANLLRTAVDSILAQTYTHWELICIDDKSTDNTWDLLQEVGELDDRITITQNIYQKGLSGALNSGLDQASGEIIARTDADDSSHPTRLQMQVDYLLQNPDRIAVGCEMLIVNEAGEHIGHKKASNDPKVLYKLLCKFMPISHPTLCVRADIIKQCRYNENFPIAEDLELLFNMAQYGQFGNVSEPLYTYRLSKNSISLKNIKFNLRHTMRARLRGIREYNYKPDLKGIAYSLLQLPLFLLPEALIFRIFQKVRFNKSTTKRLPKELIRYILIGIGTVAIDWLTYILLTYGLGVNYLLADLLNTPFILIFNYFGHKYFTFRKPRFSKSEIGKYLLTFGINQLEAWLILFIAVDLLASSLSLAKLVQLIILPVLNYLLLSLFVFRKRD